MENIIRKMIFFQCDICIWENHYFDFSDDAISSHSKSHSTSSSTSFILSKILIHDFHSQPMNNTISTMINCCCSMTHLCLSYLSTSTDCNEEESSKMVLSSHLSQKESMPYGWNIPTFCQPPKIHSVSWSPPYFSTKDTIIYDLQ